MATSYLHRDRHPGNPQIHVFSGKTTIHACLAKPERSCPLRNVCSARLSLRNLVQRVFQVRHRVYSLEALTDTRTSKFQITMASIEIEACELPLANRFSQQLTGQDKKACVGMLFSMMSLQRARNRDAFPGANPVSIERAVLPKLFNEMYWASAKTDGNRILLMAVTLKGRKLCVMVDRSMRMYVVTGSLPTMSFESSLLDGELVEFADGRWRYLVFDCIYLAGLSLGAYPFSKRMMFVESWLQDLGQGLDDLEVRVKRFAVVGRDTLPFEDGMPDDGLIFVPEFQPYSCYRNDSLLKWKAHQQHTVDFRVEQNKLMVLSKSRLVEKAKLHQDDKVADGSIVECQLTGKDWRVVKVRTDKTAPNDQFVLGKTIDNIKENIQRCELGV